MIRYYIAGGILFFLDAASKWGAKIFLAKSPLVFLPDFFSFHLAFNEGIAFSLPVPRFAQIFITLAFLVVFFFWARKEFSGLHVMEKWGAAVLLSGAVGNLWERILFGHVTDFISIWQFPIFNIADICISLGVGLWIFGIFFSSRQDKKGD